MPERKTDIGSYFIYILLVLSYFLAGLLRTSSGVVLPDVSNSIKLVPASIGLISGAYFYGYAILQPSCGALCDDKGPLLIEGMFLSLFAAGLFLFAWARTTLLLCVARLLIGAGAGPTFSGLLVYQARAFPGNLFSKLTGVTVMLGHLGGVVSITPLGYAVDCWGYKTIHLCLAVMVLIVSFTLLFLKSTFDRPSASEKGRQSFFSGFAIVFRTPSLKALLFFWSIVMLLHMNLMGLWGVIWIQKVSGAAVSHARLCMSSGGLGVLAGAVVCGIFGNKLTDRPKCVREACALLCVVLLSLTVCIELKYSWIVFLTVSFFLGIVIGAVNVMCNIFAYRIVGADDIGTVIGAANLVIFLSVLLSQWFSGAFIHFYDKYISLAFLSPYAVFFLLISLLLVFTFAALCRVQLISDAE